MLCLFHTDFTSSFAFVVCSVALLTGLFVNEPVQKVMLENHFFFLVWILKLCLKVNHWLDCLPSRAI